MFASNKGIASRRGVLMAVVGFVPFFPSRTCFAKTSLRRPLTK